MIENPAVMTSKLQRVARAAATIALGCVPFAFLMTTAPAATLGTEEDAALVAGGHVHGTGAEGSFFPGSPCEGCPTTPLEIEQGSDVEFTGLDEEKHRVVSKKRQRGRLLFNSAAVANGDSTLMITSNLKPGTYDFFCSFHPSMTGVLAVR